MHRKNNQIPSFKGHQTAETMQSHGPVWSTFRALIEVAICVIFVAYNP